MPKYRRGGYSGGSSTGGGATIKSTSSLLSERERYQAETDQVLEVLRGIERDYGVTIEDMLVAQIASRGGTVLGYYDWDGRIAINEELFKNAAKLDSMYDESVRSGFHPGRGRKSGLEAVLLHELGHRLNYIAGGGTWSKLDSSAYEMVETAARKSGHGRNVAQFRAKISGYAREKDAETVAEAFADVKCNGSKASKESIALYEELTTRLNRTRGMK